MVDHLQIFFWVVLQQAFAAHCKQSIYDSALCKLLWVKTLLGEQKIQLFKVSLL